MSSPSGPEGEARLCLFGPPRLLRHGVRRSFSSRRALALLAYLALEPGPHARERLAALLFPEASRERGRAGLRQLLWLLGRELPNAALQVDREAVALDSAALEVDVTDLRALLDATVGHGHAADVPCPDCLERLRQADGLAGGPFMDGFALDDSPDFEAWQAQRGRLASRDAVDALARLADAYLAQGDLDPAIDVLQRLVALDPLDEGNQRRLIESYGRSGRRQAALQTYEALATRLAVDVGARPETATEALRDLVAEGALEPAAPPPRIPPGRARSTRLVGRENAWAQLEAAYARAGTEGALIVVEGESGIGKTRLAQAFAAAAAGGGADTLTLRCYQGEGALAYGAVIDGLESALRQPERRQRLAALPEAVRAQLARLMALGDLAPVGAAAEPAGMPDGPGAQRRLFEAAIEALTALCAGEATGVLVIDDLQWADGPTLELLGYAVRRLALRPLLILATWREDEAPTEHAARVLVAEALRLGVGRVLHLDRLGLEAVAELASEQPAFPADLAARLHLETEGLPLLVVAYLASWEAQAQSVAADAPWPLPVAAQDLLRARLDGVPAHARPLLVAAALLGRPADAGLLTDAAVLAPEETVEAIEALLAHGVMTETPEGSVAFAHEKLRNLATEGVSSARQALTHRRIADALAARAQDDGGLAGQVVTHLRAAGDLPAAAAWSERAGRHAWSVSALAEAQRHFLTALELGHADRASLQEAVGDLRMLAGRYAAALQAYSAAVTDSPAATPSATSRLERKRAVVWSRLGEWERAHEAFERASSTVAQGERAALLTDWGRMLHRRGDSLGAAQIARSALEHARVNGGERDLARALNLLGLLARADDDMIAAREHFERGLALAHDEPLLEAGILNNLALLCGAEGDSERALSFAQRALDLCRRLGDRPCEAALHSNIADLLHALRGPEGAMEHLKAAAAIYADVARDADTWFPEVWKLYAW